MYDEIIADVAAVTDIRGRRRASAVLLEIEIDRILGAKQFAQSYGKSEWLAGTDTFKNVELDSGDYKKLMVCFEDGTHEDIASKVSGSSTEVSCPSTSDGLTITESCGIITLKSDKNITAVRSLFKLPASENRKWVVENHKSMLVAYLRWQLLGDIDAKSAGIAYNTYSGLLRNMSKLETV